MLFIRRTFMSSAVRFVEKRKRFYKEAIVTKSNGKYGIHLDQRKLKTPHGKVVELPTEPLALIVAHEWNLQQLYLQTHSMHLTLLCNTAIDNPMHYTPAILADFIMQFMDTDTVCLRQSEPKELAQLQRERWDPLLDWFGKRFGVTLSPTNSISASFISTESRNIVRRHLLSHDFWSLIGIHYAVECLKSVVLSLALIDRQISSEDAASLSRLETEFQISNWGTVEWAHQFDLMDLRSRVAASALFVYLNSESSSLLRKVN